MIKFKRVDESLIQDLATLAYEIWFEYYPEILTLGQIYYMINKFQSAAAIKDQMRNENYCYFLVQKDGENVGYFGVSPKNDHLFLSKLYFKKSLRGKGFGKMSFDQIVKIAKNNNFDKIQLTVNKFNTHSIKTYEYWGFKIISNVTVNIGDGYLMEDFIMEYEIKES